MLFKEISKIKRHSLRVFLCSEVWFLHLLYSYDIVNLRIRPCIQWLRSQYEWQWKSLLLNTQCRSIPDNMHCRQASLRTVGKYNFYPLPVNSNFRPNTRRARYKQGAVVNLLLHNFRGGLSADSSASHFEKWRRPWKRRWHVYDVPVIFIIPWNLDLKTHNLTKSLRYNDRFFWT